MRIFTLLTFLCAATIALAQSDTKATAFVFKGGLSLGTQKWDNSFERQPLFAYHGALAIESADVYSDKYALFAQAGYHVRGSATRFRFNVIGGGANTFRQNFEFHNAVLILGAKQKKALTDRARYYYFAGLRGEYNISNNLDELREGLDGRFLNTYPSSGGVNDLVGGVSLGGGIEFDFAELIGGVVELAVHPDFTYQYNSPPFPNVTDPFTGQPTTLPQRQIRNVTIELSVGIKLVRKVIYE